ncbi:MAG: methylmalonyl-CoA mutase, partial [Anaerolineaceae bacterium]|nr:methylmalonyl-CoA mutase [Anaerolineaceae bacterium]
MFDETKLKALKERKQRWEETTMKKSVSRQGERLEKFMTTSSMPIERLYTPLDVEGMDYERDLGFPGEYPYTRGVHATMHRG